MLLYQEINVLVIIEKKGRKCFIVRKKCILILAWCVRLNLFYNNQILLLTNIDDIIAL